MENEYEAKVKEFLMEKENLAAALEVADHMQEVKRLLVLRFWHAVADDVQRRTEQMPTWMMLVDSDEKLQRGTGEPGMYLEPKSRHSDPGYFAFKLGDGADAGLFYGILCAGEKSGELRAIAARLPEFRLLKEQLDTFPTEKWGSDWLVGRYLDELTDRKAIRANENIKRLAQGNSLADSAAAAFVELVETYKDSVEAINGAIAKSAETPSP